MVWQGGRGCYVVLIAASLLFTGTVGHDPGNGWARVQMELYAGPTFREESWGEFLPMPLDVVGMLVSADI